MWRPDRFRMSAMTLGLVVLVACGGSSASRVSVDKDQTDIVFGFTKPTPRPAASALPQATAPVGTDLGFAPFTPHPIDFIPSAPSGPCPTAEPNAPVEGGAPTSVSGRPKPGTYAWGAAGTYDVQGHKIPLQGGDHYIRDVASFDDPLGTNTGDGFTYETFERQTIGSGYNRFSWQVKTASSSSDPEDGLVLKGIDATRSDGTGATSYFKPFGQGLLVVPFPIKAGQTWNTASLDLSNGRTLQMSGQVLTRQILDICGKVIEGWHVHADWTDSGTSATIDLLVAPQYAGQILAMTIDGTYLGTQFQKAQLQTRTLEPKPLPKGFGG